MKQILDFLSGAYPKSDMGDDTIKVYSLCLQDLPFNAVKGAVLSHIATNKWFPTVAEIRAAAVALMPGGRLPTALEAWGEVKQAFSSVGYYGQPKFSHEAISKAVEAMGWQTLCKSENDMADRAHFMKLYDVYAQRLSGDFAQLPEVARIKGELAGGNHASLPGAIRMLAEAKRVRDD